ncbi:MAG: energy transducer TonB [Myxococcaceae bacterium]
MFDVVRGRSPGPTRVRPALLVSLLAHAVLLAAALGLSRPVPPPAAEPPIHWVKPHGPRAGGSPGPMAASPPRKARHPVTPRSPPRQVPRAAEPAPIPSTAPGESGSDVPSVEAGTGPGGPGGPACATPPCGADPGVLSEDVVAAMPVLLSGPDVTLSPEARRTGVEGTVRVRCIITAAGTVEGCEVLERLPLAEAAVLAAIQGRRYRPAEVEGRAVSVRHLFTIRIRQAR